MTNIRDVHDRAIGFWTKTVVEITNAKRVTRHVDAYQHTSNLGLAVTPQLDFNGAIVPDQYRVTHVATGESLWPETWKLDDAKDLCLELLAMPAFPGWSAFDATSQPRMRDAATEIGKRYYPKAIKPPRKERTLY